VEKVVAHHPLYDTPPNWNWKTKHSKFLVQQAICIFVSVLEMRSPLTTFTKELAGSNPIMDSNFYSLICFIKKGQIYLYP
jgi:hypothetical protein